jgi:hypothetical protein
MSRLKIALTALSLFAFAAPAAAQQPIMPSAAPSYDITVTADQTKENGSPWDGIPGLKNSKLNLNHAPDIAVCLVRAREKPDCLWKPEGARLLSLCQNSWTCKFWNVPLTLPVGVVLIDIDARNHDAIDTLILTDNSSKEALAEISDSMRTAMSILQPQRSEDTKEHLVRDAKIIPIGDCAAKACRLTQSEITIEKK